YIYRVPPGLYTITPSDPKYVFNPPSRTISIASDDSVGNDFEGALLGPTPQPTVTSLSPNSTTVRLSASDPPLFLNVTGSNFVAGAKIYVNGVAMPTLFLSSTVLSASIPATSLQSGSTLQVTVQNPDPTLGISAMLPLLLTNPGPVLATVEPATFAMTPGVP